MKQGSASHSGPGARKVEPTPRAVNPAAVAQIGTALGNHATGVERILPGGAVPIYSGRGYEAPKAKSTIHHGGSQGRHE